MKEKLHGTILKKLLIREAIDMERERKDRIYL